MSETVKIDLNTSYVEVAASVKSALIAPRTLGAFRIHVGASLPANDTDAYISVGQGPVSLSDLDAATDRVFLRAEVGSVSVGVIRG